MHPLDGPCLKLCVAHDQLTKLWHDGLAVVNSDNYRFSREIDSNTGEHIVYADIIKKPDPRWGAWIGECAHDLRSALDGLVWQIAYLSPGKPGARTSFPIFIRRTTTRRNTSGSMLSNFEKHSVSMLRGVGDRHRAMIERLQPYKRWHGYRPTLHPLWLLDKLNNADKHKMIQVVTALGYYGQVRLLAPKGRVEIVEMRAGGVFVDRTEIVRLRFLDEDSEMNMEPHITTEIQFGKGTALKGFSAFQTLRAIYEHVRVIITETFVVEFSHRSAPPPVPEFPPP